MAPAGAEDTAAPFSVSWDTTAGTNGTHSLTAVARDAAQSDDDHRGQRDGVECRPSAPTPNRGIVSRRCGNENNANVVFVEKFDENVLTDLFSDGATS
jgi:hypothetical protein